MDLVICASLIEHVPIPTDVIRETLRVLKPGGFVYLSFPPFYTPLGGHQFSPFHLLGQRFALRVNSIRKQYHGKYWLQERYPIQPVSFAQAFGGWGLYPLTIAKVERILAIFPIETVDRSTRWLPLDFSGLPLLREFLTWHVQFLFRKR
jgi:SAM-dependent methyltransferase